MSSSALQTEWQTYAFRRLAQRLRSGSTDHDLPSNEWIEQRLWIQDKESRLIPLRLNNVQRRILDVVEEERAAGRPPRLVVLKARQMGVSTAVGAMMFEDVSRNANREALVIADDDDNAKLLFGKSRLFFDMLPEEERPLKRYSNKQELVFENPDERSRSMDPGLRSAMRIETAKNVRAGRSRTLNLVHATEAAFWPTDAGEVMLGINQAVPDHPDTMIVLESTANGVGGYFHDLYWAAKRGENEWRAVFFPWFDMPEYVRAFKTDQERAAFKASLDEEERRLQKVHDLTLEQLHWRRWTIANKCEGDVTKFRQEYPSTDIEAFVLSGNTIFDPETCRAIYDDARPGLRGELAEENGHVRFHPKEDGRLIIWQLPQKDQAYAIGADVAEGHSDGDASSADVCKRAEVIEQIAQWHGRTDTDLYAQQLILLGKFYHQAYIGVETNGPGLATIVSMRGKYPRIYQRRRFDSTRKIWEQRDGWQTSSRTKPIMESDLKAAMRDGTIKINSKDTAQELLTYVEHPNGEHGAQEGAYDDRAISLMITLQVHQNTQMPPTEEQTKQQAGRKRRVSKSRSGW